MALASSSVKVNLYSNLLPPLIVTDKEKIHKAKKLKLHD